jgi:acetoin utilization protein AcuB
VSREIVFKIMNRDIVSVSENFTMKQAAETMRKHKIRHLPVTNQSGSIVGILSDRDISRLHKSLAVNDFEEIVTSEDKQLVKYHMHSPVIDAKATDSLVTVINKMLHQKISCLLIVDEFTAPCGIVTTDDMLRHFVDSMDNQNLDTSVPVGSLFKF